MPSKRFYLSVHVFILKPDNPNGLFPNSHLSPSYSRNRFSQRGHSFKLFWYCRSLIGNQRETQSLTFPHYGKANLIHMVPGIFSIPTFHFSCLQPKIVQIFHYSNSKTNFTFQFSNVFLHSKYVLKMADKRYWKVYKASAFIHRVSIYPFSPTVVLIDSFISTSIQCVFPCAWNL